MFNEVKSPVRVSLAVLASILLVGAAGCVKKSSHSVAPVIQTPQNPPIVYPPDLPEPDAAPARGPMPVAYSVTVNVVDGQGSPVSNFRWLLEEENTYPVNPGTPEPVTLGTSIHRSHSPTLASGETMAASVTIGVPVNANCLLSVLPKSGGYALGGTLLKPGQANATVVCHELPFPTAQLSVLVFRDDRPLNNAPDFPAEVGLQGFTVTLADQAGQQMLDAFGNMLGTTYLYNADGTPQLDGDGMPIVDQVGFGYVLTDANGEAFIQNLQPGKFAVRVRPPAGQGWIQTTTIEGSPVIDAWVTANQPQYLVEFGMLFWHAFFGFTKVKDLPAPSGLAGNIKGQAVYLHENRPPLARGMEPGRPVPGGLVALNDLLSVDEAVYVGRCDDAGFFDIQNVPPGTYQLVIWDESLDVIVDFRTIIMPATAGTIDLGEVAVFAWFGFYEGAVFHDHNQNGFRDPGEEGIPDQALNLRFSDGTIYKSAVTDPNGCFAFPEVFPWFKWIVAEVDFARYKATGATCVVDAGGALPGPGARNNPQLQPDNNDLPWRTETGLVLLEAMTLYAGQTNQIYWGKDLYADGENGGISGIVYYATTRAEDDPRLAGAEPWEPGIPRIQVSLYTDTDANQQVDDLDGDGKQTLADVDNHPLGWAEGGAKGWEDVDYNGNGVFDTGDAVNVVWTDCWDDSHPTGSVGPVISVNGQPVQDGAEIIRTWNQVRPGVFDGGYAFTSFVPGGMFTGNDEVEPLPGGYYVVEVATPPGYRVIAPEDKNVVFGETYVPQAKKMPVYPTNGPPPLVGTLHLVPDELSLFAGEPAPFAGTTVRLGDRKQVLVSMGKNEACDFYLMSDVPKGARIIGWALDDLLYEFNPSSPNFGSNLGAAWIPISIQDWRGVEIERVYTDQWGRYNAAIPSTFTNSLNVPSGMSPGMYVVALNHPGPIPDPNNPGSFIIDPHFNPAYGQVSYPLNFLPANSTNLDTPVVPVAAFSAGPIPPDFEFTAGTPVVTAVDGPTGGPYVATTGLQITILSAGITAVPNPDWDPTNPLSPATINRDFGFGPTAGSVTVGGVPLTGLVWAADGSSITATVPGAASTGQLTVTRGDNGMSSIISTTLHVGNNGNPVVYVAAGQSLQAAVDAALPGTLLLVRPGVYHENLVVWKPVRIQGFGFARTTINGGPIGPVEVAAWDAKLQALLDAGSIELIPGTNAALFLLETSAVFWNFKSTTPASPAHPPLIDGFTVTGSPRGGGVFVNAYVSDLQVGNNFITGNQGAFGGGIRSGTKSILNATNDGYMSSFNPNLNIHNNKIVGNGGISGGGGISLYTGSGGYLIERNFIAGNQTILYGGGIEHMGLSPGGAIRDNWIVSNSSFDEGGGIFLAGELIPGGAETGILSPGAGSVTVAGNVIQGNFANDDGGGVRTLLFNGQDVKNNPLTPANWHVFALLDNYIVNNVSSDSGGAIGLYDTARAFIINNTIAHNDSTGTGNDAFGGPGIANFPPGRYVPPNFVNGGLDVSLPQPGGISAQVHSALLQAAFGVGFQQTFCDPVLEDNVIWQNRSFYWDGAFNGGLGGIRPDVQNGEPPIFWDLAVIDSPSVKLLNPQNSVLTSLTFLYPDGGAGSYAASNTSSDPLLAGPYFNIFLQTGQGTQRFGNMITIVFYPTGVYGDYHLQAGSSAINLGAGNHVATFPDLAQDRDGQNRAPGGPVDAGADER